MSRIPRGESLVLQFILAASLAAVAPGTLSCAAGEVDWISAELAKPVLVADAGRSSWLAVMAEVKRADAACDAAWRRMKTREELQRYGKDLRSRMIRAMGGFPSERRPLNARTVSVRKRDGYTVENVLFENWPGVHVSANLYLPDATRFPPPHPGVLIVCGHGGAGKSAPYYSRGGVMSSRAGIAALVVDPLAQGEPEGLSCGGGGVLSLPGERTIYDVMRDELNAAVSARRGAVQSADVRRIAGIAVPGTRPPNFRKWRWN